jgi:protease I
MSSSTGHGTRSQRHVVYHRGHSHVYGPWVLCSTPALKGKTATGFSSIKDDMVNAGATFVDKEVVVDGNVITSRKPDDLPAFVVALMELMGKA